MIFIVGHQYKWVGPVDFCRNWNSDMEHWKKSEVHTCQRTCNGSEGDHISFASFTGIPGGHWSYGHVPDEYFEDVTDGVKPSIDVSSLKKRRTSALSELSIE